MYVSLSSSLISLPLTNPVPIDIVSASADTTLMVWEKKSGYFVQKYAEHTDEVVHVRPFLSHYLVSVRYSSSI